jgi:hypothetical protein
MAQPATGTHTSSLNLMTPTLGSLAMAPGSLTTTPSSTTVTEGNTLRISITLRSYNLDKLIGLNYLTWATWMILVLKLVDLWDTLSIALEPRATNNAEWMVKDLQVQVELMFHLGDPQV